MLLIHQGDAPTPYDPEKWGKLSEAEQNPLAELQGSPEASA